MHGKPVEPAAEKAGDVLVQLRLIADIRQAALVLRGIDSPDAGRRVAMVRRPEVHHALGSLMHAVKKLVGTPDEGDLFWHPARETLTVAERRFERLRHRYGGERP